MLHGGAPALGGLAGQTVDEVQGQVVKSRLPGPGHRLVGLLGGVGPVNGLQLLGLGRLHANGQAVHARPAQPLQVLQGDAVGVTFHGDLGGLFHLKQLFDGHQQLLHPLGAVVAGGSAPKVDGVHGDALSQRGSLLHVGEQGLLVLIHLLLFSRQGIEVAVIALTAAEGDMDIDAQLVRHGYTPRQNIFWNKPGFAPPHYIPPKWSAQGRERREGGEKQQEK